MRSKLINPPETFMSLLRKAGYYLAGRKTDFNFDPADPKAATFATDPPPLTSRANCSPAATTALLRLP